LLRFARRDDTPSGLGIDDVRDAIGCIFDTGEMRILLTAEVEFRGFSGDLSDVV
jgi:hypothetical protein